MNKIKFLAGVVFASLLIFAQSNFSQNKNSDKSDNDFPVKAYSGGMMEVQLGQLAQQKASNPKVKQFGERMISDHSNANKELKDIADKNNISLPDSMLDENKTAMNDLSKYDGTEFDKEYMKQMVKDHKKDVREFEDALKDGGNKDVIQWVKNTLPTLKMHLKMAEDIQKSLKEKTK